METVFGTSFEYKLIYVFAINNEAHKGLLKIGDMMIRLIPIFILIMPKLEVGLTL